MGEAAAGLDFRGGRFAANVSRTSSLLGLDHDFAGNGKRRPGPSAGQDRDEPLRRVAVEAAWRI
jgi:hypothetical protein